MYKIMYKMDKIEKNLFDFLISNLPIKTVFEDEYKGIRVEIENDIFLYISKSKSKLEIYGYNKQELSLFDIFISFNNIGDSIFIYIWNEYNNKEKKCLFHSHHNLVLEEIIKEINNATNT